MGDLTNRFGGERPAEWDLRGLNPRSSGSGMGDQLEDADRRGVNPYAPENQRAWGQTVAQATGQLNPTEQADTSSSPLAEPEPGTVIGFTKHFREDGPGYAYVAIRVKGRGWFLTGSAAGATTWDDLLEFADGVQLWVTRDWTRLS